MRKPSIAVVNHEVQIGGAEVALLRLAGALRDRYGLCVFLPGEGPLVRRLKEQEIGVEIVPMPKRSLSAKRGRSWNLLATLGKDGISWRRSLRTLATALRAFDGVITGSTKAHLYGGLAARMAGRPLVWWFHDVVDGTTFGFLSRLLVRAGARRLPHRVLAVSHTAAASLALPRGDSRLRVLHHGIPERPSGSVNPIPRTCDAPRVGWIGRLIPSKGPGAFLDMAARVLKRVPRAEFVLAGAEDPQAGGYAAELERRAKELGIGDRVRFLGYQEDVWSLYSQLTVLACTSLASESLGLVAMEAMTCGVPVVAFSCGGVEEVVEDGHTGYVVPRGRVDLMAERVARVLESVEEREALAASARAKVRRLFGWDAWVEAWDRELSDVLREENQR